MTCKPEQLWAALRIVLGWIFLWAFLDKVFGLGFATKPEAAWIAGGSPTSGFLQFGTHGPLASMFQVLAGNVFIDGIFMLGLLLLGLALILGIGVRIAGHAGALLMFLMWLSLIPPANNPIVDEHIVYLILLLLMAKVKAGQWYGLGKWWSNKTFVKNHPILE
ncbi:MAG: hypothetical protein ABIJ92_03390 [Candidatus Aenigmatarchaeota archaeon]